MKWKAALPGTGHSSPVVSKGKVFVTTCIEAEQKRVLLCLDRADGRVLWERVVLVAPLEKKHKLNSHASSTAAADGERVYVTFCDKPRMRVYCYDFAGNKLWEQSPGEFHSVHGFCSSPGAVQGPGDRQRRPGRGGVPRRPRQADRRGEVADRPAEQAAVVLPAGDRRG